MVGNSTLAGSTGPLELSHLLVAKFSVKLKTLPGATDALESHNSFSNVMLNLGPRQTALKVMTSSPFCSAMPKWKICEDE